LRHLALTLIWIVATTSVTLAQTLPPALTLTGAIAGADASNPEIAAARRAVDVARATLTQTAQSPLEAQVMPGVTKDVPQGLGVLQTLGGGISQQFSPTIAAERVAAQSGVAIAAAQYAGIRRDVDQRVVTAYYALASAQAIVNADQQSVDNAKQIENGASIRAKVGAVGTFEALRAQVELRRVQTELLRAQAAERSAQIALDVLLARSTADRSTVVMPTTVTSSADTQMLYAQAQRIDPQLAQFRASVEQAVALERAAKSQRAPSVGISVGYLVQRAPAFGGISSGGPTALLTVSVPLGDHGTIRGAEQAAQARQAIAREQLRGRDTQVQADVEQTVAAIESAKARLAFSNTSLDQAREVLRLAQFGYARGALSVLDILSARNELSAAQSEVTQASADLGASIGRLQLIVGEPVSP
jgi:cobalt-zinc-cadmium efflux system outer membrane protein